MNAVLLATFRRNWRLVGAMAAFLIFTVIHFGFFRPAAERYRKALASVGGIEAVFNPGGDLPILPPRVFALITDNSLASLDAQERGSSGALGVVLLEGLGRNATRLGLRVITSEPLPVTQEPLTTQVRAHMVLRGPYTSLATFFGELSAGQSLVLVERFEIHEGDGSDDFLEIWVSRLYLKQPGAAR